jgi:hypothetical protein
MGTVEYVADAVSESKQKSLIILGHIPSEQAGMEECTRWLKTFVTEVPVQFVPAREPFPESETLGQSGASWYLRGEENKRRVLNSG